MGLNKQKGNMYGFVTHTWNTVKGKCPHACSYCYMKRFKQPELHFDEKELKTNLGSGNFIFVGSSCDMFAEAIPDEWIKKTLLHCKEYPENQYLFQTKNPTRFLEYTYKSLYPDNTKLCVTIESNRDNLWEKYSGGQPFAIRADECVELSGILPLIITIEPIMDFDLEELVYWFKAISTIEQVSIGADSSSKKILPEPPKEKILELISELEKFTKVHLKPNLNRLIK